MFSLKRTLLAAIAAASIAAAQPALTTIQDTLYKADGSRFTGTMFITWSSFQAGDTSNVATSNLTLPIVNGVLRVSLVPTTTASPGAQYTIKYNSRGITQFTETWAVPPSSTTLRVRDVRISQGTVVGPSAITTPIQIGDVTGLTNELALRPMRGVGFAIGRTAIINTAGQIDGASGLLSDCVHVDGSSGPCGSGGGLSGAFSDAEVPGGTIDGNNLNFTLQFAPSPASSLQLFRNGLRLTSGADYSLNSKTITFFVTSVPLPGDSLTASYRYANPSDPTSSFAAAQVVCSSAGTGTSSPTYADLGTCTIPGGILQSGDRLRVEFQYAHSGSAEGFSAQVLIGSTPVLIRDLPSSETFLSGIAGFAIGAGSETFSSSSFGVSSAQSTAIGTASESLINPLTVDFKGHISTTGSDSVVLQNFTVVRYPAQSNP